MQVYKGFSGNKVIIKGNRVQINQMFRKEMCDINDILKIKLIEPKNYLNGKIIITTKNTDNEIHFTEKQLDTFKDLYNYINEHSDSLKEHNEKISKFKATKKVGKYFYIDEKNDQWAIPILSLFRRVKGLNIFNYDEISSYELIENGLVIAKGGVDIPYTHGELPDAISNTCNDIKIKINLIDNHIPVRTILFLDIKVKKTSNLYQRVNSAAYEVASLLEMITKKQAEINKEKALKEAELKDVEELDENEHIVDDNDESLDNNFNNDND